MLEASRTYHRCILRRFIETLILYNAYLTTARIPIVKMTIAGPQLALQQGITTSKSFESCLRTARMPISAMRMT